MIDAVAAKGYTPDATKRACYDCRHCKAAVSWWCKNPDAVAWRGSSIPGVHNCPFWDPVPTMAEWMAAWRARTPWFIRWLGPSPVTIPVEVGR